MDGYQYREIVPNDLAIMLFARTKYKMCGEVPLCRTVVRSIPKYLSS
jgi:hypothetical protein